MAKYSHEQRLAMMQAAAELELARPQPERRENPTSLCYWWPKVKDLGIPVPRTMILPVDAELFMPVFDGEPLAPAFAESLHKVAADFGFPLFLRTDLQSGKHGWKDTCYIPDPARFERNVLGVVEENLLGACSFGPMFEALVFREFLELETSFIAFYGDMPVNKERRYFVRDGAVVCHHPYWPPHSIEGHTEDRDWPGKLAELNEEIGEEVTLLSRYALLVSAALPGFWSVDFAKAKDGKWYLIDIALGGESYHWPGCGGLQC